MTRAVLLYRAVDATEGALIVQLLEENGVPTTHTGGTATIAFGELPADARQVDVWVPREQAELARRLIVEHQALSDPRLPHGDEWTCPCGESNGASFQLCWNCGRARA